jgi:hypothetical protein
VELLVAQVEHGLVGDLRVGLATDLEAIVSP